MPCMGTSYCGYFFRCPACNNFAAPIAAFRAQIDDPVSSFYDIQIMFNNDNAIARIYQLMQHLQQFCNIGKM